VIVVSDTSPLTNLAAIDQFNLLHLLYDEIHIPMGVWDELNAGSQRWPGRDEVSGASWIHCHVVKDQALVTVLRRDLDRGEAEGIALALELEAELILLDEHEGRRTADRLGLSVVGIPGVLLEAKAKGLIDTIRPLLDALRMAGFYLSEPLYQRVLAIADED
jgi:uncharacterized protein